MFKKTHATKQTRAKVLWQKVTSLDGAVICKTNIIIILYHIRQVAARFAKLVLAVHFEPPFCGMGGHRGSVMVPFERVMVVSYRLSIVTLHYL